MVKITLVEEDCVIHVSTISGKNSKLSQEHQSTIWNMVYLELESGNSTSDNEKEQLFSLWSEYSDVLSLSSSSRLGRTSVIKHHINAGDAQPVPHAFHRPARMKLHD